MIRSFEIILPFLMVHCSTSSSSDAGADSQACASCEQDAGLCEAQFPPVPSTGCPSGQYVCQDNDPGFSGCTPNKFCAMPDPNYSCENVPCNVPVPDGGCPDGTLVCTLVLPQGCVNIPFCGLPTDAKNECVVDASTD